MAHKGPIALDYTLHDLFALDNETNSRPPTLFFHPSRFNYGKSSVVKFTYNTELRTEVRSAHDSAVAALAVKGLPQRYAFAAGPMEIVVLDHTAREDKRGSDEVHMGLTMGELRHDQRPTVTFAASPDRIRLEPGTSLLAQMPADCVAHLPAHIDPEVQYGLVSKRGLALSGLPSPHSTVVDSLLGANMGGDPTTLGQEVDRILAQIDTYPLPFVVKLNQSISSKGVFIAFSEVDRAKIKATLVCQLQEILPQMNAANHHLHPSSLVLQDFVPGKVVAVSLFVTRTGRPIFIACCEQRFDKDSHWIGGSISYPDQMQLHQEYSGILDKVAHFLHQKGFYGPAGVDVLTSPTGHQYIIDLNPRLTGTYYLAPLAGHFLQRGLTTAALTTEYFSCLRGEFEAAFSAELQDGKMIIAGWVHDESIQLSHGTVTVGGGNLLELGTLLARVVAFSVRKGDDIARL